MSGCGNGGGGRGGWGRGKKGGGGSNKPTSSSSGRVQHHWQHRQGEQDRDRDPTGTTTTSSNNRGRRRRSRGSGGGGGVDPADLERQLQRQRQNNALTQQGGGGGEAPVAAAAPDDSHQHEVDHESSGQQRSQPRNLPGLEYDPVRGRYFPPAAGRRRATPSPQHVPATSVTAPAFSGAASFSPPSQNVASRILSRRQGHNLRGRDRDILRMGEVGRLFHLHQQWVDRKSGLEDVDFQGNQLVTGSRNGLVQLLLVEEGEGNRSGQMIVVDLMSRPTAIARVRWRKSGGSVGPGNIVAVAEVGGGEGGRGGGATAGVTVCKILGLPPSEEEVSFRMDRFPLGQRDLWSVEWDPFHGRKLLPGLSKGPLVMLDVEAGRQVHHPFRLSSDCFASTWGNDDNSVLLGMRNGQVSMVDLRSPSPMVAAGWVRSPPLTTMGCIVDQVEMLPDGRGVLASDRLGTLRLLDLRYFGRALYDFPPPPSLSPTLASTGFVLDPVDQTLCMTLTPEGVVRMFDLAHGRAFEEAAGSIAPRGPSLAQRTGSATPRRCFLARAWGGAGGGSHHQQSALWPSLFCGDRTTGDLFQINLQRDPS